MKRRTFLQLSAVGGGLAAAASIPAVRGNAASTDTETDFTLTIAPANAEMIDGTIVYMVYFFGDSNEPSPEMRVLEGDEITVAVTNGDNRPHQFGIPGVSGSYTPLVHPGETRAVTFTAPVAGSYLYIDPYLAPLNRVLGLHGAFIIEPRDGETIAGSETPYSRSEHTPQLQALFDALGGGHHRFPGDRWRARDLRREKLWVFTQIDPSLNQRVAAGEQIDAGIVAANFLPRYFTINGLSGFDTAVHQGMDQGHERAQRIMPSGKQGQPCLLRTMNAGLANHAVHVHGNHCFELAESQRDGRNHVSSNIYEHDTWFLRPLQRIDTLLPFERPPDIPDGCWPPRDEPFPLRYVMHCHFELSQTAGGGNYPQGAVTHWEMTAPL